MSMAQQNIECVGIIMDGNRRFAKAQGIPVFEGHRAGYEVLKTIARTARDLGVVHLIAYAFSTENWKRSEEEVSYLMKLLRFVLTSEAKELAKENIRVRFIGERARFDTDIKEGMEKMERETSGGQMALTIALSYGGRAEIVDAVRRMGDQAKDATEETFSAHLWTAGTPDPSVVIRTGGEQRLSNFLPWQTVYSELSFTKTLWPDFSPEEFKAILAEVGMREKRYGA
ncbi:MAG: Isoprenyl transferase [Parcubacteria group bacterium GW2011_GWA1_47_8]|nr:MAG: Isoprenyl transferase [Parcubacteria group bacterium GW2011_GWA1_47_8]